MIYEYECECGHVQEEIHGMNESPEIKCERCRCIMRQKITGGAGTIFKGSGWTTSDSNFKRSMLKKSEKVAKKQADHQKPVTCLGDLSS
ncbi:MAG: hypothetical protein Q7R33_05090 [Nitrosarchaeum sp.]|nr:hypothetical protein [Nitrosarchaeum sp.]